MSKKVVRKVTKGVFHKTKGAARVTGRWLWEHKRPILVSVTWFGLGTIIGAVRVIPPPTKFVKLGLFRIG